MEDEPPQEYSAPVLLMFVRACLKPKSIKNSRFLIFKTWAVIIGFQQ